MLLPLIGQAQGDTVRLVLDKDGSVSVSDKYHVRDSLKLIFKNETGQDLFVCTSDIDDNLRLIKQDGCFFSGTRTRKVWKVKAYVPGTKKLDVWKTYEFTPNTIIHIYTW